VIDLCRDCQAPVIWCLTESGARMPVDAKPIKKVMVLKINPKNPGGPPIAKFVNQHESHFASCPAAASRRGTGTQNPPNGEQDSPKETPPDAT
jgi:hypothetical protein